MDSISPEEQDRVARRVVHDVRGPLNAIGLAARLLDLREDVTDDERRTIESIIVNVRRAAAALEGLVDPAPLLRAPASAEPLSRLAQTGLRVLVVEDVEADRALILETLASGTGGRLVLRGATTLADAEAALAAATFDVVLLDLNLPDATGLDTIRRVFGSGSQAAVVVLTGVDDELLARQALRAGAQDYIVKGHADSATLLRAIAYARERRLATAEREQLIAELNEALATVKRLSGIVPICAGCKSVRGGDGAWQPIEQFVHAHSDADFSHGLCPDCARRLYPEAL